MHIAVRVLHSSAFIIIVIIMGVGVHKFSKTLPPRYNGSRKWVVVIALFQLTA